MRVDTASPDEIRRYVFAGADPGISELAASIRTPRIFIKMCGPGERLLAMASPAWRLQPPGYLMAQVTASQARLVLPPNYRMEVSRLGSAIKVAILSKDGALAASGYAASSLDVILATFRPDEDRSVQ